MVGCSLTSRPTTTSSTTSTSGTTSSSTTVWSGSYTVNAGCSQSQCCCAVGSFTMTQIGTQVTGTVNVAGQCGGVTTAPFSVTLSSSTATSGMWGQNNLVKNGVTVTATNTVNSACSATLTCTAGDCLTSGSSSTTCFHESTLITYKGLEYSMMSLSNHEECRIPHIVTADGLRFEVECSDTKNLMKTKTSHLRLTADHLVFTFDGLVAASSLRIGHVVFSDMEETNHCHVKSITHETGQRYFGLNCLESVVLANSIKTSTFGRYHTLPAAWMSWVGNIFGTERASRWGDSITQFFTRINVI